MSVFATRSTRSSSKPPSSESSRERGERSMQQAFRLGAVGRGILRRAARECLGNPPSFKAARGGRLLEDLAELVLLRVSE